MSREVLYRIAFDQHGTYKNPLIGPVRCTQRQISNEVAKMLLKMHLQIEEDPDCSDDLESLATQSVKIFKGLHSHAGLMPAIHSRKDFLEYLKGTLVYRVRPEQESALRDLACCVNVSFTMISAMPSKHFDWAWRGLGSVARAYVGQKARGFEGSGTQMILRADNNPMLSKLVSVGVLLHGLDYLPEERDRLPQIEQLLIDDDINFARTASRLWGVPAFIPVKESQLVRYPLLDIPECLQDKQELLFIGGGLPVAAWYLASLMRANFSGEFGVGEPLGVPKWLERVVFSPMPAKNPLPVAT